MTEMRELADRMQRVADSGDFLSVALLGEDPGQIEGAVDDLISAYDYYAGQAAGVGLNMGFDEIAAEPSAGQREQRAAAALASALADLEVASLLGQAAQLTEEGAAAGQVADLDEVVGAVGSTAAALQGADEGRYGFDELATSAPLPSGPLPAGREGYRQQVQAIYDALIGESSTLLSNAFGRIADLDEAAIRQGLETVGAPLQTTGAGRLAQRALEAAQRAIGTLRNMLGEQNLNTIEQRIDTALAELRKGEGAATLFLKYSYDYDEGQKRIAGWLEKSTLADEAFGDAVSQAATLQAQAAQAFALEKRLVNAINTFRQPADWLLRRLGAAAPLDLLLAGAYLLIMDIAILRGMDYADTTTVFSFVDGVQVTSRRALGVAEE